MWGEDVEPQGALRRPSRRQFGIVLTELQKVGVEKNERQGSSDRITAPNDVLLPHCYYCIYFKDESNRCCIGALLTDIRRITRAATTRNANHGRNKVRSRCAPGRCEIQLSPSLRPKVEENRASPARIGRLFIMSYRMRIIYWIYLIVS